jgi:hypothetical protein
MKYNIFEINDLSDVQEIELDGSKLYIKDNFYKYPNLVLNFIELHQSEVWKEGETPSYNMIHFQERRHHIEVSQILEVSRKLSKLTKQKPVVPYTLATNYIRFIDRDFNNFKDNYWWPHLDCGYTAIIYFDNFQEEIPGTNLYKKIKPYNFSEFPEHYRPWIDKDKFQIIHSFKSKFNRLVLFDGKKFLHNMAIEDDKFFYDTFRKNQVIFFSQE